ncbi:MAG TPA: cupin domain-containing protein [Pyrinomonadaceae bacterium]|nr:cupin domain-containing protein [Pyrinomonadaceae bacterium]
MTFGNLSRLFALLALLSISTAVQAQEMGAKSGQNITEMKFTNVPGLPTCVVGSVQNGDPTKGPSIIFAQIDTGCVIPWHWHTPSEHLMMVSGIARIEMKDRTPLTLESGGYALMPSRHVHQFRCNRTCSLYIYSDAAFDIHYLDAQGNEISTEEALKSTLKKKPGK